MKITASFVPVVPPLASVLAGAFLLTGLLLAGASAWLVVDTVAKAREKAVLTERLTDIESRLRERALIEALPPLEEMAALRQRAAAVNTLTEIRGWPATALLARFEEWLPDEVSLVSLRHRIKDGEIVLVAESENADLLTGFMHRLEKEPHFSEVLLSRQGAPAGGRDNKLLQYELRLRERP
ncbi:MAG: PilN domain-containing protein [Gammaproteobacteria bacterium]|nr:PilN domain-containing protein [Gammaproteobacteria bacterium]